MTRLVAILVTLFLVAIPAKADVTLSPPVPGWTVIKVYGVIQAGDLATFQRYTENVDPQTTLVIVTGPGGNLVAGIGMGMRVHQKKLIVGVMGECTSSCALIWIGGETGRKFFYQDRPGVWTLLCFHQASRKTDLSGHVPFGPGTALISKYLADLGYNRDMIEWATAAVPNRRRCLNQRFYPELAKKFNIDFWYNTEDGQHYSLPGNHGLLPPAPPAPSLSQGDGATPLNPSLPNGWMLSLLPPAPPHPFDDVRVGPSPLQANDRPSSTAHASESPRWNFRVWSYDAQKFGTYLYFYTKKDCEDQREHYYPHGAEIDRIGTDRDYAKHTPYCEFNGVH
jgi:hypothetical protein